MKKLLVIAFAATLSCSAGARDYDRMHMGDTLLPGDRLVGQYANLVMQSDGNLVLYSTGGSVIWHAGTQGKGGNSFNLQYDVNLVIYKGQGIPANAVWSSGTGRYWGIPMAPPELIVEGTTVVLRYAGMQNNSGDLWRRPTPLVGPVSCEKGNEFAICMYPRTSYQFTTKILACSRTDAERQANIMGGVVGEC